MKKIVNTGVMALALVAVVYAGLMLFSETKVEAEGQVIGYVDSDRIMEGYAPAISVNTQLASLRQKSEADLEKSVREKFGPGEISMLPRESQLEIQKMVEAAEGAFEEKSVKLRDEKWEPIVKSVNDTISKVALEQKIQVVVDKAVVIYGGVDITDKVLAKLPTK